jgi:hypothetical protein
MSDLLEELIEASPDPERARAIADEEAAVVDRQYDRILVRSRWGRDAALDVLDVLASSFVIAVLIGIPLALFVLLVGLALEVLT